MFTSVLVEATSTDNNKEPKPSSSNDKDEPTPTVDTLFTNDQWTADHHLVNNTIQRSILRPTPHNGGAKLSVDEALQTVAFCPENAEQRHPALWRSLAKDDEVVRSVRHVAGDWSNPPVVSNEAWQFQQEMLRERVQDYLHSQFKPIILPQLVLVAVMEEITDTYFKQQTKRLSSGTTRDTPKKASKSSNATALLPPKYYTQSPNSYLIPPSMTSESLSKTTTTTTKKDSNTTTTALSFTPNQLISRIKQGCTLAYQYYANQNKMPPTTKPKQQQQQQQFSADKYVDRRASSRLARQQNEEAMEKAKEVPTAATAVPDDPKILWKVVSGGRVASFLVDRFEGKASIDNDKAQADALSGEGVETAVREETDVSVDNGDDKAAEETRTTNGNHASTATSSTATVFDLADPDNPYFVIDKRVELEWMGLWLAKHINTAEIQDIFDNKLVMPKPKSKKAGWTPTSAGVPAKRLISGTDKDVWDRLVGSKAILSDQSRLVFKPVTEDTVVGNMDAHQFARIHFTVQIIENTHPKKSISKSEEFMLAEQEFKDRKVWEKQRFQAIHSGHTIWPSWSDALSAWYKETIQPRQLQSRNEIPADESDKKDLELAMALEEQGTRSTRRVGRRSADVFYGTQSGATNKQFLEVILRTVASNSWQTTNDLLSLVQDGSADPMRRLRTLLGRLYWKRNQLSRLTVDCEMSDKVVKKTLRSNSLLLIGSGADKSNGESTAIVDEHEELNTYIRHLHHSELILRKLVMQNLGNLPVSYIATAADERPGKIETMDEADFEDTSQIEWQTSGHNLLNKTIYRPHSVAATLKSSPAAIQCNWFRIVDFTSSIPLQVDSENVTRKSTTSTIEEPKFVERRSRFRAYPYSPESNVVDTSGVPILLTEAQGRAGILAAEAEKRFGDNVRGKHSSSIGSVGSNIVLISTSENGGNAKGSIDATLAGFNTSLVGDNGIVEKCLFLFEAGEDKYDNLAIWTEISTNDAGAVVCQLEGQEYVVQLSEYDPESPAAEECRNIVKFLNKHPKARPFLEPVDPVALGIPEYTDFIKEPMDISTLSSNIEKGVYSKMDNLDTKKKTAGGRMLNGKFKADALLIFDNAIQFNSADDWIHQSAQALRKLTIKKIEQAVEYCEKQNAEQSRSRRSVYVDDNSDVDMYVYESDYDEDFGTSGRGRKRKKPSAHITKDEPAMKAVENVVRLTKQFNGESDLAGHFTNFPVVNDANNFSLDCSWNCRKSSENVAEDELISGENEVDQMYALHCQLEQNINQNTRRSVRSSHATTETSTHSEKSGSVDIEYYKHGNDNGSKLSNRYDVELKMERDHEALFAKQFHLAAPSSSSSYDDQPYGVFSSFAFPPYLGHVRPVKGSSGQTRYIWEIRKPYIFTALRWVIRGLIQSEHMAELEPLVPDSMLSGVVLPNIIYYIDPSTKPFDLLEEKELMRRKRANNDANAESSEEEIELSEYEKLRLERVARNADRLKALGLG